MPGEEAANSNPNGDAGNHRFPLVHHTCKEAFDPVVKVVPVHTRGLGGMKAAPTVRGMVKVRVRVGVGARVRIRVKPRFRIIAIAFGFEFGFGFGFGLACLGQGKNWFQCHS